MAPVAASTLKSRLSVKEPAAYAPPQPLWLARDPEPPRIRCCRPAVVTVSSKDAPTVPWRLAVQTPKRVVTWTHVAVPNAAVPGTLKYVGPVPVSTVPSLTAPPKFTGTEQPLLMENVWCPRARGR